MATVVATLVFFIVLLLSFLAARRLVTRRGMIGALWLGASCLAVLAIFAYAASINPAIPLDQSLSYAFAQMFLIGSALGIPAGFVNRWRKRTNK